MSQELIPYLVGRPNGNQASKAWSEQLLTTFLAIRAKTVSDVLAQENRPENTIGALARKYGDDHVRAVLVCCMTDFLRFFNLTQGTMDGPQVVQTILLIQEDYGYLTMADFKVFFNKIKKGHFAEPGKSQVYNRIDGQLILEWLGRYAEERWHTAALQSEIEAYRQKDRDQRIYTPEMIQRLTGEHWAQKKLFEGKSMMDDLPALNERTCLASCNTNEK